MASTLRFKRQRELGEMITDVFKFLRENYKILWQLFIRSVLLPFILLIGATIFYNYSILSGAGMQGFGAMGLLTTGFEENLGLILLGLLVLFTGLLAYNASLFGMILHAIKSYNANAGTIQKNDVTNNVKKDFGKLMGLSFLFSIIVGFGLVLCVIPGVYGFVPLSLVFAIAVFENKSVGESISYSFNLITGHWWISFATLFIFGILVYIISLIFQIPMIIYFLFKGITMAQEVNPGDMSSLFDTTYLVLTVLANIFQYLLYSFFAIISALIYFNINERKFSTGTLETINSIGKSEDETL